MRDSLYLAWRYLRHNRLTTAVLVASVTLILYLPVALQVIVWKAENHFRSRALTTPLLVGPRGSELELVLSAVYFDKPSEKIMRMERVRRIESQELGKAIPLHTRFTARGCPIVGTNREYLRARDLQLAQGKTWAILGECLVGYGAAKRLGLQVGDKLPVQSSPAFVLDSPPLRLRVAGLVRRTETPDDEAVFVELDTAWVMEGLGHGHASNVQHGTPGAQTYTDITRENAASFHFHGDRNKFPISAMIVMPNSEKAETILLGQYLSPEETLQIVRPADVVESLLKRVLMVRSYIIAAIALVSIVTVLTMALVMVLSVRLRRAELATITMMGCSRHKSASLLGMQVALILAASAAALAVLLIATTLYGHRLVGLLVP